MIEKKALSAPATIPVVEDFDTEDAEPQGFDAAATKRLLRKLDWHIIPFMSLIYL